MDSDERQIYEYIHAAGDDWVNGKEICRRAGGKRRFEADPYWATPVLQRMKDQHILEADMSGRFRIIPDEDEEEWVEPDMEKLLSEEDAEKKLGNAGEKTEEDTEQP